MYTFLAFKNMKQKDDYFNFCFVKTRIFCLHMMLMTQKYMLFYKPIKM